MTTLTTRSTKGSALSYTEGDDNLKKVAQTKGGVYTVAESDNRDVIEVSASTTITLPDATTIANAADTGDFEVTLKNTSGSDVTVTCTTGADTIDGSTSDYTLGDDCAATFKVNQAGSGYNITTGDVTRTGAQTLTNKTLTDPTITSGATDAKLILNHKIVDIGPWDMDTTANLNVAHGLTLADIRRVTVMIIEDGGLAYHDFMATNTSETATANHRIEVDSTNVALSRPVAGFFDSTDFNNAVANRGYIVIDYID